MGFDDIYPNPDCGFLNFCVMCQVCGRSCARFLADHVPGVWPIAPSMWLIMCQVCVRSCAMCGADHVPNASCARCAANHVPGASCAKYVADQAPGVANRVPGLWPIMCQVFGR